MAFRFVLEIDQERERVDKVLPRLLRGVSRATTQRWIAEGRVQIDGKPCRSSDDVRGGTTIEVDPGPPPASDVEPDATVPFTVLYEDADLVLVDKPAGIVVHPGRGNWEGTLVSGLLARPGFERAPFDPRDPIGRLRPGIVHRIDKGTSGVLVVAKTEAARAGLKEQLSAHTVDRVYRAITLGTPMPGRIETLHGRDRNSRIRFTSLTDEGRRAVTNVSVDEPLAGGRAALVSCRLETGRTHQIRVHLAEQRGTPILADATYGRVSGDAKVAEIAARLNRQALHAAVLGFEHPTTRERVRFESPLPIEFRDALDALRQMH